MAPLHVDGILDICKLILGRSATHFGDARAVDLSAHGIEVIGKRLLGKGAFNDVYTCLLKEKQGTTVHEIAIKKVKSQLYNGQPTTVQTGVGIDHSEPRLAHRNIATSILDSFLGTASAPRSSTVVIDGRSFVAMTIAPGISAKEYYRKNPTIIFDPVFQRKCSDLEILAYLSGNPDVHSGNIMISAARRDHGYADTQVTMIDNDLTFGPNADNPDRMTGIAGTNTRQYRHTGLPAYIDINTASRIRSMQRRTISDALQEFLIPSELNAFEARLDWAFGHIDYLKRINHIVFDWNRFVNVRDEILDGGNFIEGTLEFSGVMQGSMGKTKYFCPRSIIVRDCLEDRLGGVAELDALIGPERRALLHGWAKSTKKHIPPSGIDHR